MVNTCNAPAVSSATPAPMSAFISATKASTSAYVTKAMVSALRLVLMDFFLISSQLASASTKAQPLFARINFATLAYQFLNPSAMNTVRLILLAATYPKQEPWPRVSVSGVMITRPPKTPAHSVLEPGAAGVRVM